MAGQYDNTNRGVLFRKSDKTEPRQPDYTGNINVDGEEFWISGWIKIAGPQAKNPGSKFLSLSVTPKGQQQHSSPVASDFDDDIPF